MLLVCVGAAHFAGLNLTISPSSNVWAYEELLRADSSAGVYCIAVSVPLLISAPTGPALTFSQMLFIAGQQLPSFVIWDTPRSRLPRLKPRQVPISQWLLLVTTFASGTLLNNIVFAFNVPLTIQIIFRSAGMVPPLFLPIPHVLNLLAGLAVSMLLGRIFMGRRYTLQQIVTRFLWRLHHSC